MNLPTHLSDVGIDDQNLELSGDLPITYVRSEPDNTQNEEMLANVNVTVITGE